MFSQRLPNLYKCAFGVRSGKFPGFMLIEQEIEPNLEKLNAMEEMSSLTCQKNVECLNGRLATWNNFLLKANDEAFPFFQILQVNKKFEWTTVYMEDFKVLRQHIHSLLTFAKPVSTNHYFYI